MAMYDVKAMFDVKAMYDVRCLMCDAETMYGGLEEDVKNKKEGRNNIQCSIFKFSNIVHQTSSRFIIIRQHIPHFFKREVTVGNNIFLVIIITVLFDHYELVFCKS